MKDVNKKFPAYHPSSEVCGKLRGITDHAGHFHFLCPHCADNQILQIHNYSVERDGPAEYAIADRPGAKRDFKIAFRIYCPECKFADYVELASDGIQGSKTTQLGMFFDAPHVYPISN